MTNNYIYHDLLNKSEVEIITADNDDEVAFLAPVDSVEGFINKLSGCGANIITNEHAIYNSLRSPITPALNYVSVSHLSSAEASNIVEAHNSSLR